MHNGQSRQENFKNVFAMHLIYTSKVYNYLQTFEGKVPQVENSIALIRTNVFDGVFAFLL